MHWSEEAIISNQKSKFWQSMSPNCSDSGRSSLIWAALQILKFSLWYFFCLRWNRSKQQISRQSSPSAGLRLTCPAFSSVFVLKNTWSIPFLHWIHFTSLQVWPSDWIQASASSLHSRTCCLTFLLLLLLLLLFHHLRFFYFDKSQLENYDI